MAKLTVHQKFPCGYEFNATLRTIIGTPVYTEDPCPLHGKKCVSLGDSE